MTNIKPVSLLSGSNEGPNANIVNPGINSSSSRIWDDDDDFVAE